MLDVCTCVKTLKDHMDVCVKLGMHSTVIEKRVEVRRSMRAMIMIIAVSMAVFKHGRICYISNVFLKGRFF